MQLSSSMWTLGNAAVALHSCKQSRTQLPLVLDADRRAQQTAVQSSDTTVVADTAAKEKGPGITAAPTVQHMQKVIASFPTAKHTPITNLLLGMQ